MRNYLINTMNKYTCDSVARDRVTYYLLDARSSQCFVAPNRCYAIFLFTELRGCTL